MKNIFITITLLITCATSAQVAIEKSGTGNPSVLLEFNDRRSSALNADEIGIPINGENKTLILPIVEPINPNSVEGTIWLDATDNKFKYRSASGDVEWSYAGPNLSTPTQLDSNLQEITDTNGVIIGSDNTAAPGILVLENTSKVMVLPNVDSVSSVINPEAGSIVYDKTEKAIALFNGEKWHYWGNY